MLTPYLRGCVERIREKLRTNRGGGEILLRWHDGEIVELLDAIESLQSQLALSEMRAR